MVQVEIEQTELYKEWEKKARRKCEKELRRVYRIPKEEKHLPRDVLIQIDDIIAFWKDDAKEQIARQLHAQ
jgi:hypothetical protein